VRRATPCSAGIAEMPPVFRPLMTVAGRMALMAMSVGLVRASRVADFAVRGAAATSNPRPPGELSSDVVRYALGFVPPLVAMSQGAEEVTLWQSGGIRPMRKLKNFFHVTDVKFFPSGDRIAAIGPRSVAIWEIWLGRAVLELVHGTPPSSGLLDAQIFPDGGRVVTLGSDKRAIIWCAASGRELLRLDLEWRHQAVRVLPGGDWLVTGVSNGMGEPALVWNTTDGKATQQLVHSDERVSALTMSPCGKIVGTVGYDCVSLWGIGARQIKRLLCAPHPTPGESWRRQHLDVAISESARRVVASSGWSIIIWDGHSGELLRTLPIGGYGGTFLLMPGGDRVLTHSASRLEIWDTSSGKCLRTFRRVAGEYNVRLAVSGEGVVAVCGETRTLRPMLRMHLHADLDLDFDDPMELELELERHRPFEFGGRDFPEREWREVRLAVVDAVAGQVLHAPDGASTAVRIGLRGLPCSIAVGPSGEHFFKKPY